MARPISIVREAPVQQPDQDLEALAVAVAEHRPAIEEILRLLQGLHERGLLAMLIGAVEQFDRVTEVVVTLLNRPENVHSLQNGLALLSLLSRLDPHALAALVEAVSGAAQAAAAQLEEEHTLGVIGWMRLLRQPEVNRGLQLLFGMLQELGTVSSKEERVGHNGEG
ncbi:MAG: DUF1641 domain-containing protein [Firmicutes bacterium]|nr:DUF1641 domain-containing protein [Bacillota bacterium]